MNNPSPSVPAALPPGFTLDEEQAKAVRVAGNVIACVAGPGSGKTRVLVARANRLFGLGVAPVNALVLTFTNAGADEFTRRLAPSRPGYCGTLHGFLLRLLCGPLGMKHLGLSLVGVATEKEQEEALAQAVRECRYKGSGTALKEAVAQPRICMWDAEKGGHGLSNVEVVALSYYRALRADGLLDFDSVLHLGALLIERAAAEPEILAYTHLFWDEAQDGSPADWRVFNALPCRQKFVVGDPDQSIYAFRGAEVRHLVKASTEADQLIVMANCYRCRPAIATAASHLIGHNSGRVDKAVQPTRVDQPGEVKAIRLPDPGQELSYVLGVALVHQPPRPQKPRVAVLARTNALAREFASFLSAHGISVASRQRPVTPPRWSAALAILGAMARPWNDKAVSRALKLSSRTDHPERAARLAAAEMKGLHEYLGNPFHELGTRLWDVAREWGLTPQCETVLRGLPAGSVAQPDPQAMLDAAMALFGDEDDGTEPDADAYVGTIHSAKGREWPVVVVVGCEEGGLPSRMGDVQEERRLMFVAMTRAEEELHITCSATRSRPMGKGMPPGPLEPRQSSRFIFEANLALRLSQSAD